MNNTTHWMEDDYDVCTICNSISMNGLCDTKGCAYYGGDEEDGLTLDELIIKDLHHEKQQHAIDFAKWLAKEWMSMWVVDKWLWENVSVDTNDQTKWKGYYTEEQLYELYLKECNEN